MSTPPLSFRPALTPLEPRENPDAVLASESFEQVPPPTLPVGWQTWSTTADGYITSRLAAATGTTSVASLGSLSTTSRLWANSQQPADAGVSARIRSDGPAPVQVIARGQNLATGRPSYLAAVVHPGGRKLELVEVKDGTTRALGAVTVSTPVYGVWLKATIQPEGGTAAVRLQRPDTGQFLTPQGGWQATPVDALKADVTHRPATGMAGVGRSAGGTGYQFVDDVVVTAPPVRVVKENFDTTPVGQLPARWAEWTNDRTAGFGTSTHRARSAPNGMVGVGTSVTAARTWLGDVQPADVQASASAFTDTLIPGSLLVRGKNLDTSAPTYYAVTLVRGIEARLVKVVDGAETTLASVRSKDYVSWQWVRLILTADGDQLRAVVYRADAGRWLTADGYWSDIPQPALEAADGSVTGDGFVGFGRAAGVAGSLGFDDLEVKPASGATGPQMTVTASQPGTTFAGDVTFRATAAVPGSARRVEFRLNGQLRAAFPTAPAEWTLDTTFLPNGDHELAVRALDVEGNVSTTTVRFTTANPNPTPPPERPAIPRHHSHIRIAALAYNGNPMGEFEKARLRDSVDLVIPNTAYLTTIDQTAPDTPQLVYSNVSNLYQGLLTDWLDYADRTGVSRELAFYHVTAATPFTGSSPSSQPVNRFWGVYRGPVGGAQTDFTSAAFGGRTFGVGFGAAGDAVSIGYPEKFREINVTLNITAKPGWLVVWEYPTAVGPNGGPTGWKPLTLLADGTAGLGQNGRLLFDPPADWAAGKMTAGSARLFYVRARVVTGTAAQGPEAKLILGRDYVGANGGIKGTIPAFDYAADGDGDGYLSDAEYAGRAPGKDARFAYEGRMFYPQYGQMRFATNPAASAVRRWAADFHTRMAAQYPLADGFFLDNSNGRLTLGASVIEPTGSYSEDYAGLVAVVWRTIAPRIVVTNTAGGWADATPVARESTGVLEEFVLRPVDSNWANFTDVSNLIASRLGADDPPPYVIVDSHPGTMPTTDNRVRVGTLASYYLLADPDRTMLMFFGGLAPSAPWVTTWIPAASTDVGRPAGAMTLFAQGKDPENAALDYKVFAREYEKALVLYKPRSYTLGKGTGTLSATTATTHDLGGQYRVLNGDGTLGPVVTSISLRNGEGAVLMKV